ncbi:hypothetical protein Ahy_B04g070714 [Arachis hypogaea]|uniref:SWIM-type domain-containing protein n=1 Tax=Arachis hypogaea TaxID=3818 RepID=A0A444ZIL5_ARAHY|nr:hypothetical protein Ahy_B04g070714 [Arachis hypogaea]
MAIAKYNVTSDDRLVNLIWADGSSRVDYQYFGDVLAFDSTYKKNKYKRPIVIFSGSNNHKRRIMNTMVYTLEEYEEPDVHIMSSFRQSTGKLSCQCNFWKKHGYPCKHMFFVMKVEYLKEIPDKFILKRWRTDTKFPE